MRDAYDLINQAVTFRDLELDIEIDVNILVYSFSESKFLALSSKICPLYLLWSFRIFDGLIFNLMLYFIFSLLLDFY